MFSTVNKYSNVTIQDVGNKVHKCAIVLIIASRKANAQICPVL